jgi:hypothetical protein
MPMKSYLIWLDSGESIEGNMEDNEVEKMCGMFDKGCNTRGNFKDTEGILHVDFHKVAAIGVNDIKEEKNVKMGY